MEKELREIKINWFKVSSIYNKLADRHLVNIFSMRVFHLIIIFQDDCTQKKIVEMTGAPKQSVNNVIQDFLDRGYIKLVVNPKDKRYKLIKITKNGKKLYEATLSKVENAELKVLSQFSDEEIKNYVSFSKKFNDLLEKETEEI